MQCSIFCAFDCTGYWASLYHHASSMVWPVGRVDVVMREASDKNQVQVIARAAHIMRALEGEDAGLSLGQIAARVGLARSTVQRIVASLESERLLIAASPTGRVRLGPAILRLASSDRRFRRPRPAASGAAV